MARIYKVYRLFDGNEIVYIGVTNDIDERVASHRRDKDFNKREIVSSHKTRESARSREQELLRNYQRDHRGRSPKFNIDPTG